MKVAFEDFQREVGPLDVQSWDRTSVKFFEVFKFNAC